jgi:8-oxo-dGTP pyrophosphatase MutT (NUDIX family)
MATTNPQKRGFAAKLVSRVLHSYFLMTRGLTLGVRAIVRDQEGRFLLVRHSYTPGWHFPGGGVEKGETVLSSLRNELLQETGLQLKGTPILHGVFYNSEISKRDHVLVYICDVSGQHLTKPESLEISQVGFFYFDNLPDGTEHGTIRRLREVDFGESPSEFW